MSDRPRVIHVHVYEDYLPHFEDQGKVWRVTDHTSPADIDRGTTAWVDKTLVDELIETIRNSCMNNSHETYETQCSKILGIVNASDLSAIQGEDK